ncbi:N,N-dimethylformamidase beta subunit family domain-containing protein [Hoeflea olei]|uniref:N,N-dimethylformamidase beta subunit-like C-terminal domain-containing protein n=1 Tax=Hoeflea olei TaxID=1480615 RepID=A0A1C1YS36_9HYPH|nr:N,N-dimethylformamidase beta subunit family domain-containing protein [Hoeflea olei]OCW56348.1 hypothetical protein AWJ14_19870 [Hoeflea olei]
MHRQVNHSAMSVVGYTTPWAVAAGHPVDLHLSCATAPQSIRVRRLDTPGREILDWPVEQLEPAAHRMFGQGSCLRIPHGEFAKTDGVTGVGFELFLSINDGTRMLLDGGALALALSGSRLSLMCDGVSKDTGIDLPQRTWLDVALSVSARSASVSIRSRDSLAPFEACAEIECGVSPLGEHDLLMGSDAGFARPCLNGKISGLWIETPRGTVRWRFPTLLPDGPIASKEGPSTLHVEALNLPTFCVTSPRWDGSTFDPRVAPEQYDAVYLHDDDMGALDWPASCRVRTPAEAESGIYAFEVDCSEGVEQTVFFVSADRPRAPLVFVVPTATYLAYADEYLPPHLYPWMCEDRGHRLAVDNDFKSLYDFHRDLSGVSICSYRKAKATLREDYRYPLGDCPHNLPVDLHFLRFCRTHGISIDVITDHDLHNRGLAALTPYRAVVTGSHPEYMSVEMEGAYRAFAAAGGSIAYMGGNGFAGTVAFRDDLMELRRSPLEAGRTWDGPVGEQAFAITNEPGGHLRSRGRGEFSLMGVGISLMGFEQGRPFTRTEASRDEDCAWLFDGVENDTFGSDGIVLGAAAGYEVDALDHRLGSSADIKVVARATGFPDSFFHDPSRWYAGGEAEMAGRRCAEMTIRNLAAGGLLFSASSVAWLGALPGGTGMNDVGRITLNLLDRIAKTVRQDPKTRPSATIRQ